MTKKCRTTTYSPSQTPCEAGARLVDAIPDAWRVSFWPIWRERGDEVFDEGAPPGKESGVIAADSLAMSVAVLLKIGPAVVGPFADHATRARAARVTRTYMDERGRRFLTGVA
jgi:hypothetical protein